VTSLISPKKPFHQRVADPSGNLKAPTLRHGGTLLVGFGEEAYQQVLGG
jgi:hypothetical protein